MQTINNAFAALGLAPNANAAASTVKVSSEDAIRLEEEYSAHK